MSCIAASRASTLLDICVTIDYVINTSADKVTTSSRTTVEYPGRHLVKFRVQLLEQNFNLSKVADSERQREMGGPIGAQTLSAHEDLKFLLDWALVVWTLGSSILTCPELYPPWLVSKQGLP